MEIPKQLNAFRKDLEFKRFRENTVNQYVSCVASFLACFNGKVTEPKKINADQVKDYLMRFTEHNTQRSNHSAIKCFFKYTLKQKDKFKYIEYCKRNRKLPIVLSVEEMKRIIFAASNIKHKAILCLMYSTGIRIFFLSFVGKVFYEQIKYIAIAESKKQSNRNDKDFSFEG